jgi:hypothetical protein
MAKVELVHSQGTSQVSVVHLITICDLFKNNPSFTLTPYQIQSEASLEDFQDFISALEGKSININDKNFPGLSQLSEEFGFQVFLMRISNRRRLPTLPDAQRIDDLSHILCLEKRVGQHEHQLAALQHCSIAALQHCSIAVLQSMLLTVVRRFETDLARLGSELKAVHDTKNSEAAATQRSRRKEPAPAASPPTAPAKSPPAAVPSVPAQPARVDSLIVTDYPPLFEEFWTKRWLLLWRGNRDGFTARRFHHLCNEHANTLTLILDPDGNVFGGFTPVEWESSAPGEKYGHAKGDDSLRSFLFTLTNLHGVPPQKFALRKERKKYAIYCTSTRCTGFCKGIAALDNCNTNRDSWTWIGTRYDDYSYVNDTRFGDFFTGAQDFTVKEIEVFEID